MSDAPNLHVDPEAQQILDYMGRDPLRAYQLDEIVAHVREQNIDARAALLKLERLGLIDHGDTTGGGAEYFLNPAPDRHI